MLDKGNIAAIKKKTLNRYISVNFMNFIQAANLDWICFFIKIYQKHGNCNTYAIKNEYYTVWSEEFLYKVAPPELKISPIMYFVIHNSVVLSKILKIVVP